MPRWSDWKRFKWRFKNEKLNREEVRRTLPGEGQFVYELGIKPVRGKEKIRTVYVGHGRAERMSRDHLGWIDHAGAERFQAKTGPYMKKTIRNGFEVYIRYMDCRDNLTAISAEERLIGTFWWKYPWNDAGMPWAGARKYYKEVAGGLYTKVSSLE